MKAYFRLKISIFFLFAQFSFAQYITVNENYSAQELVEDVLFNTPCASVSNVQISGANFASGEKSYAYFNGNSSSFPFLEGLVLTTGKAINAQGPNSFLSDDGNNMGWLGDSDLETALNITNTINATVLEFDFVPLTNSISFSYIFSSEEYHGNAPCNYSDGFAFLLKNASDTNYQNLALIPNTNIPVKVTSVRPQINGANGCAAQNEQYFDAFNGYEHPTNYNGQTKILTAKSNVIAGDTYHIKLVIADEGNYRYDSAIFLQGGSFNFTVDLGDDRTFANGNPLCSGNVLVLNAFQNSTSTYKWFKDGVLQVGETNATFSVYNEGTYSVEVTLASGCVVNGSIIVEYAPDLIINKDIFNECDEDNDGFTSFSLTDIKNELFTNIPPEFNVSFFDNIGSTNALPDNYINTSAFSQVIYAQVTNINSCYTYFPVTLNVWVFNEEFQDETVSICNSESIEISVPNTYFSYSWNTNPPQTTNEILVNSAGSYTVTITDSNLCTRQKTFVVNESSAPQTIEIVTQDFSDNSFAQIFAEGSGNYEYSLDGFFFQDHYIFNYLSEGKYTVWVQDKNGCGILTKDFYILNYPKFFTPNNDGHNDEWKIENLDKKGWQNVKISIFNRYGKLLKQLSQHNGFDGNFNGLSLPSDDYWFTLESSNYPTIKGNFSLKR